jgi:hypothetical protein
MRYNSLMTDAPKPIYNYDVCLSFAGEERPYVELVAAHLEAKSIQVFYDDYERVVLWGKNLYDHLDYVYSQAARYCVLFVSESYASKVWTNHERKSAQERALHQREEYILPVIFDDTRLPGLLATVAHVDARTTSPDELAGLIRKKIGPISHLNYLPHDPVVLFAAMNAKKAKEKNRIRVIANYFLQILQRATVEERMLVFAAFTNRCPRDSISDPHVNLDYLRRVLGMTPVAVSEMAGGMSSLGFKSSIKPHGDEDVLHFKWNSRLGLKSKEAMEYSNSQSGRIAIEMVVNTLVHLCKNCAEELAHTLDFSPLENARFLNKSPK